MISPHQSHPTNGPSDSQAYVDAGAEGEVAITHVF